MSSYLKEELLNIGLDVEQSLRVMELIDNLPIHIHGGLEHITAFVDNGEINVYPNKIVQLKVNDYEKSKHIIEFNGLGVNVRLIESNSGYKLIEFESLFDVDRIEKSLGDDHIKWSKLQKRVETIGNIISLNI